MVTHFGHNQTTLQKYTIKDFTCALLPLNIMISPVMARREIRESKLLEGMEE